MSHARRSPLSRQHPLHVTLKLGRGLPSLRAPALFATVRRALAAGKDRFGFGLVHFSVQHDHLHLIAEAEDRRALARGMQGLTIRLARAVNRQLRRKGRVFPDRYHDRVLKTPRAVRFALRYVLLNARKHERAAVPYGFVDECSSAPWFHGFARPAELVFGARGVREEWRRNGSAAAPVVAARTWLLCAGYLRAGPFDVDEAPSSSARLR